jgi:4-hydroxybenzoate polyprenyltransferase
MHPTKKLRAVAAGTVSIPLLWGLAGALNVVAFALSILFFNWGYTAALFLLFLSGIVYNVPPIRLKDRAFLDVIAESFNNPIRLWLGWYALAPQDSFPPLSIILAWWFFGALLMTGKRYAEFRFIDDPELSGRYRKSFKVYTNRKLIISMITYANLFCFCMGAAITTYKPNLIFVFPVIVVAIIIYFNHAMTEKAARLEPEQLMRNPLIIAATLGTILAGLALVSMEQTLPDQFRFFQLIEGTLEQAPALPEGISPEEGTNPVQPEATLED